jgi:hypothetical protein
MSLEKIERRVSPKVTPQMRWQNQTYRGRVIKMEKNR